MWLCALPRPFHAPVFRRSGGEDGRADWKPLSGTVMQRAGAAARCSRPPAAAALPSKNACAARAAAAGNQHI